MKEMQNKNIINDDEETFDQLINEDDSQVGALIEGKVNDFKLKLIKQYNYFEEHFLIGTFLKLIFGIIIINLPFICIIIFNSINFSNKNKFIFFPYFITLCAMIGVLMILLVIKIGEACQMYGIVIYSWERKNIFKIVNSIVIGFFLLWVFFIFEKYSTEYNLLVEKVAQTSIKESSTQLFSRGSYTLRILFILFFWDTEKDQDNKYIHSVLNYFEYEESVLSEFHSYIRSLILPILLLSFYILLKIIFFKNGKNFLFFILNLLIIFQSLYLILYPINKKENNNNFLNEPYFSNTGCKYIELLIYLLIIFILIFGSFKEYILNLIRNKYYSRKVKNKNKIIIIIIIFGSFIINFTGYILLIVLLFMLAFDKIDEKLKIERYQSYWIMIYLTLSFILFGYSFIFGHYCFNLVYYPISYEITPHILKNEFYTKQSGKLIVSAYNRKYRNSRKSLDALIN